MRTMQMIDGHFYVIDIGGQGPPELADGQPPRGWADREGAYRWARVQFHEDFLVREYASFFAQEAHVDGVIAGVRTIGEAVADNARERNLPDPESPFDAMPVDRRVTRLGLVGIECVRFAQPDGHEGEYAGVVVRFPTGDGLKVLPRPDGTLVLDWEYPPVPREDRILMPRSREPEALLGEPMYENEKGVGPVLGYVVQVNDAADDLMVTVRLTDAGRSLIAQSAASVNE
jgi:hypothetical protein